MGWISMVFFFVLLSTTIGDPDPKKYKHESGEKDKKSEALTADEKTFLREVEEKFGVKSDVPIDAKTDDKEKRIESNKEDSVDLQQKKPLPAVIAIEIVNDTDSKGKDKRTIDANLGYGYRTNNGYSYSYFGKSNQDKGKFVIYPYSQGDSSSYSIQEKESAFTNGKYLSSQSTNVEIQPSQAYELVPVKNEPTPYEYKKPAIEFKTPSNSHTNENTAQTLYTTYNGHEFSGLSGQFPTVMPNYFVDPTQLLSNPQYQSAGLTQDHLRSQPSYLNQNQRIVPVLVLRVPSSYLKNPTAELYANLPNNYPLSQHLNSVNLQELVNQYFKKHGFSSAPQIMSYQSASGLLPESEPQHYSHPYIKPSYTQADYSGVQYSAVKPVMARYPISNLNQKYLLSQPKSLYQDIPQQQYDYQYQYIPQTEVKMQTYYIQPQYQHSSQEGTASNDYQSQQSTATHQSNPEDTSSNVEYAAPQYTSNQEATEPSVEYESRNAAQDSQAEVSHYGSASPDTASYPETASYPVNNEGIDQSVPAEYSSGSLPTYNAPSDYYSQKPVEKNTVSVQPSKLIHTEQYQESEVPNLSQAYSYSSQNVGDSSKSLVLSENYPSKDHTVATVLPYTYKSARIPTQSSIQTVSYVTPMPSSRYQSQYKIMVPQTVLRNPNSEKVSYVNSHSLPMHYTQSGYYAGSNSENDYTAGSPYISPASSKHPYPKNFYSYSKRMAKPDSKPEASSFRVSTKKRNGRGDKKKST